MNACTGLVLVPNMTPMKRAVVVLLVVLSLMSVTGCTNGRDRFCKNHPNNVKCRQ